MENVSDPSIRVAVVDDHIMVSELLALSISKETDLSLVGVVGNVADALDLIKREHPAVILLNYRLPDFECIEVVKLMVKESPDSRVVMLSGNGDHGLQCLAIDAGCTGLLGKNARIAEVLAAIRAAVRGEIVISAGESYALRSA
jgi:two-component system, NarL family, nitrate/nitrite response regulator NarL